jgi:hypothetical protein
VFEKEPLDLWYEQRNMRTLIAEAPDAKVREMREDKAAFKEACSSVLAPSAGKSVDEHRGQRIVVGQRLRQSSSDIFLGWTRGLRGRYHFG